MIVGQVFISEVNGRPYMVSRGWIHYWHADKHWVTLQKVPPDMLFVPNLLSSEHAAMYGIDSTSFPQPPAGQGDEHGA